MKHFTSPRAAALLLVLALTLGLTACSDSGVNTGGNTGNTVNDNTQGSLGKLEIPATPEVSNEQYVYSEAAQASIEKLYNTRQNEIFSAAYLGYREADDTGSLIEWLYNSYPQMPAFWPFLEEIPQSDIIGEYGDLYCVVPMDESVTFSVKGVEWEILGNGTMPHYSEPLYTPEVNRPFLMYVTHGDWPDETNLTLEIIEPNGFVATWFPSYDPETGCLPEIPGDWYDTIQDFARLYDIGYGIATPVGDMEWLPPTNLGLGNTTWQSDNGWLLEFKYDENAGTGYGDMVLYQPVPGDDGTILTPYYEGTWWMEDDSLCLGVYDGNCPFPLLISPSGEQMIIMQSDDGSVLPFFEKGQTTVSLTLTYG